jgi:hypothetical protein
MQTGWLQPGGSTALTVALPLTSITGEASGSGKGATSPGGGFPAVLGALTSSGMAELKRPAEITQQSIAPLHKASSNPPSGALSREEDLISGATLAGTNADLPGRLGAGGTPNVLPSQPTSGMSPPLRGVAAAGEGDVESGSSRAPRKDRDSDGRVGKGEQTHAVPSADPPPILSQPSAAMIFVVPVPILTPQAPTPVEALTRGVSPASAKRAVSTVAQVGLVRSAAVAHGNGMAQALPGGAKISSPAPVAGQAEINPQSLRSGIPLPLPPAPHKVPIESPGGLREEPGARLRDGTPSGAVIHQDAVSGKDVAPPVALTPGGKPAEPSHGAIGVATAPAANAMLVEPALQMHAVPGHGNASTSPEIGGGANNTVQPGSSGIPLANQNPFQRLDSLSPDPSLHLRSRSNMIEAGVESASYGWIEVKATSSAGLVSASIHATDAAAGPAIQSHLQGMSSFLTEHAIPMREVTMGTGLAGGNGGGRDGHSGSNEERQGGPGTTRAPTPIASTSAADVSSSSVISLHA